MTRGYGRLPLQFYEGRIADALGGIRDERIRRGARGVLAYFLGAPDSHSVGLYQVSLRTIARHNDITDEWAKVAVDALREVSLAYYDEDREVVYVPAMAEVEHPDGVKPPDNNHKHIVRYLQTPTLRRSKYFGAFMKAHRARFNLPRPAGDHDGGDAGGTAAGKGTGSQDSSQAPPEAKRTEDRGHRTEATSASRKEQVRKADREDGSCGAEGFDVGETIAPMDWDAAIGSKLSEDDKREFYDDIAAAVGRVEELPADEQPDGALREHEQLDAKWGNRVRASV